MANRSDGRSVRRAYRGSGLARKARPPVATNDTASANRRARLSYRARPNCSKCTPPTTPMVSLRCISCVIPGSPTLRRRRIDSDVDEVVGHTSVRSLVKCVRVSDDGLRRYQAISEPGREAAGSLIERIPSSTAVSAIAFECTASTPSAAAIRVRSPANPCGRAERSLRP